MLRTLAFLGLLLGCAQGIFLTLILVAAAVPNAAIAAQLRSAYATGQLTTDDYPKSSFGNVLDKYTECSGLAVGLADAGFSSRVRNALAGGTERGCGPLYHLVSNPTPTGRIGVSTDFRYWHGYNVIDRPFVAWFGLAGTRSIVAALLIGSLVFFGAMVGRAAGWPAAAALVVPLLLTTDFSDLPQSLPHAISMFALLVGAGTVAAVIVKRELRLELLATAAVLSGAVYCFVDVFLTPPLACGLTVAAGALTCYPCLPAAGRLSRLARMSLVAGGAWLGGWALTWLAKWVVSAALFGPSTVLQDVDAKVGLKMGSSLDGKLDLSFGAATRLNLMYWLASPIRQDVVLVCCAVTVALVLVALARHRLVGLKEVGLLSAPGLLPFLWFEVVRSHSEIHSWITFRSLALPLGLAMAAGACVALRRSKAPAAAAIEELTDDGAVAMTGGRRRADLGG